MARLVSLIAALPQSLGAATVNRFCGSSMTSVHIAAGAIAAGAGEVFICAGVESMSRVPMMGFNPLPNPELHARVPGAYISMGDTAENVARKWEIPGGEQEALAVRSHQRAHAAHEAGNFADEIVAITGVRVTVPPTAASAPTPPWRVWPR